MTNIQPNNLENIVSTLLHVGSRVLELDGNHHILKIWNRDEDERYLKDINNEAIVSSHTNCIDKCLSESKRITTPHSIITGNTIASYTLRLLPIHPEEDKIFLVIEHISSVDAEQVTEDFWKLALDAAGDGMWDVIVPDQRISFSEKWHHTFGYNREEIGDIPTWISLIHPDDIAAVQQSRISYFEGNERHYHSEFRFKCGDGNYRWVLSRGVITARDEYGSPQRFTGTHTDINERKLAEEKYFATAQMLSKLINNLHEGILLTDENNKIIYANQMFCDIYNITETPESLLGMDLVHSIEMRKRFYTDPDTFYERTVAIVNKKQIVLNEEWQMTSGRTLSRDFVPLLFGADNKGGIWKFRDVTTQKNTRQQLADLRNFYEKVLNSIGADIVVYDNKYRYLFINPMAIKNEELRQWLIGKTDEDYCNLRNKPAKIAADRKAIIDRSREEKREIEWEDVVINRQGELEYHLRYMYPVFDKEGNHKYGIGYGLNITDRVRAQQELRTSMDMFASAFNESGIGMALLNTEGKWLDVNAVLCEMTGYSKEELQDITIRDITHPDDADTDLPLVRKMLKGETNSYRIEKRYISRTNKIVQILLTVSLVRDNKGDPKFFIAQVVDITEKKDMLLELNKNNAELEITKQNLTTKINQLEDLSHIIAHNLRGPAGSIKMLAETLLTLQKNAGDPSAPKLPFSEEEAALLIHEGSISLMDSLSTLMQITEIKLNKEIPRDDCDITVIINEICNQLQSTIFEKKAVIINELKVVNIRYPRIYLENILYNLISNALKYHRPGIRPEIQINTELIGERIQLTIKDNGLGIDMERYGHKIFRLNEIFHAGYDSKGIGLYITKTQVESFGGSISLKSKPNEGCEFTVTL
jgi:PAS domain S-box-containing protein